MTDISGLTLVSSERTVFGNKRIHMFSAIVGNGADTWPSGGVQLPASDFGLRKVDFVHIDGGTLAYSYDYANAKIVARTSTASGTQLIDATPTVPTSGIYIRLMAVGTGLS